MRFAAIILAALSLPASAQTEAPSCYPFINGVHVMAPRHVWGEVGQHVYWACSSRGGTAYIYGFSCRHGECSMQALRAAQQAIIAATAKVTAANAEWAKAVTYSCNSAAILAEQTPRGELCRERQALMQAHAPQWAKDAP